MDNLSVRPGRSGAPRVLIANTTFGKGVSFMENEIKWHYLPMSPEEYLAALRESDEMSA